jgi:hypothetical protein
MRSGRSPAAWSDPSGGLFHRFGRSSEAFGRRVAALVPKLPIPTAKYRAAAARGLPRLSAIAYLSQVEDQAAAMLYRVVRGKDRLDPQSDQERVALGQLVNGGLVIQVGTRLRVTDAVSFAFDGIETGAAGPLD